MWGNATAAVYALRQKGRNDMKEEVPPFKIIGLDLLGRRMDEKAKAIIKKYLEDPDLTVRGAAKRAMGRDVLTRVR